MKHIDTWVFDMDRTLFVADGLYHDMHGRMTQYIAERFNTNMDDAQFLRDKYFIDYGSTVAGLHIEHGIDRLEFLEYSHDVPCDGYEQVHNVAEILENLPGRKFIYTNAPHFHTERLMKILQIDHHIDGLHDIIKADYDCKPSRPAFERFIKTHDINPATACFFEDTQANLKPAHDMGMKTVWLTHLTPSCPVPPAVPYVDYMVRDMRHWYDDIYRPQNDNIENKN